MPTPKTQYKDIDDYINKFPKDVQEILQKVRKTIRSVLPEGTIETISYQIPTFKLGTKYLIYFAAFKNHIGVYPASDELDKKIKGLKKYRVSKGTYKFPLKEEIPYGIIESIVKLKLQAL